MAREEQLMEVLAPVFKAQDSAQLSQALKDWYQSLPEVVVSSNMLSPEALAFLKVLNQEGNSVAKLVSLLKTQLAFSESQELGETELNALKWKIARLKLEVEVFRMKGFFPLPDDKASQKQYLREWLMLIMEDFNYSDNEKELILLDILEQVVW